ncbi:MAG: Spx/MgsR family RNA polymerase-binding regulatory protein [Alphaproteobacteria bacterium]|nr:Spx/MgsR family RNA polymerase-binding regulatory protein [Alphaproteobacteria bacterium]
MLKVYGLKNCDTCKKATKWLDAENIDYEFLDIRNPTPDQATLKHWLSEVGDKLLINRRSTSWRNLSDQQKNSTTEQQFLALIAENPTLIKRPVFVKHSVKQDEKTQITVGFNAKNPPF